MPSGRNLSIILNNNKHDKDIKKYFAHYNTSNVKVYARIIDVDDRYKLVLLSRTIVTVFDFSYTILIFRRIKKINLNKIVPDEVTNLTSLTRSQAMI